MSWRPGTGAAIAEQRAELLERIRGYFRERPALAVDTPALSNSAVSDPNIDSLKVSGVDTSSDALFLHTSPEFCMKRLLADGYPDIYSICRVFRGGEIGRQHQPEFTMIEWYRLGFSLDAIIEDTLALVQSALCERAPHGQVHRITYRDAFLGATGLDPLCANIDELADAAGADRSIRASLSDDRQAWLDLIFSTAVCEQFSADGLTVVSHFPARQAALARLSPSDASVAERFEVFAGPLELANGYVELTDEQELRRRFESDLESRNRSGKSLDPLDEHFLRAVRAGLPDCAGVALGFERLHMLYAGKHDIRDVLTFEFEN